MASALANGDRVEIRGLWSFYVKKYKPYTRDETLKPVKRSRSNAKKLPFFKPGYRIKGPGG